MVRNVVGVIVGMIVGMIVNMSLIMLNMFVLFPMPAGMNMNDPEQIGAHMATLPTTAFLVVIVAHLGQAFVGGWVAARIGVSKPILLAMIIGVLSLLGGVMNMMQIEHPSWMLIELPLYLVVAWIAGSLVQKSRAGAAAA